MNSPFDSSEENLPYAHTVRPEGRVHEMGWIEKAGYLWKYLASPKTGASPALLGHFAEQKRLQAYLSANDEVTPAGGARLGFLGDIMWLRNGWGDFLPPETLSRLQRFDALAGNLESVVSAKHPVIETWPDLFLYNSDPRLVTSFRSASGQPLFGALSFANNHVLDQGDSGALETLRFLRELGIPVSGMGREGEPEWCEFSRQGIRFGFYAATFGLNDSSLLERTSLRLNRLPGLAPERPGEAPDLEPALAALRAMEEAKVDVKILYLHWGFEYEFYPTAQMMEVARALVGAGADWIFGSHPHIQQPMEVLFVNGFEERYPAEARQALMALRPEGNSLVKGARGPARQACVLYSLGNFATAMYTFYCRAAAVAGTRFYRDSRGQVRWTLPEIELFYNQAPGGGRKRLVVPMEKAELNGRARAKRAFLEQHLFLQDPLERAALGELPRLAP